MTPEAKVKRAVTKLLKSRDVYYFYPVASGYGSAGIPDIVACHRGLFIGIECKAGKNQPTALQLYNIEKIRNAGGLALVVWEDLTELVELLDNIQQT